MNTSSSSKILPNFEGAKFNKGNNSADVVQNLAQMHRMQDSLNTSPRFPFLREGGSVDQTMLQVIDELFDVEVFRINYLKTGNHALSVFSYNSIEDFQTMLSIYFSLSIIEQSKWNRVMATDVPDNAEGRTRLRDELLAFFPTIQVTKRGSTETPVGREHAKRFDTALNRLNAAFPEARNKIVGNASVKSVLNAAGIFSQAKTTAYLEIYAVPEIVRTARRQSVDALCH